MRIKADVVLKRSGCGVRSCNHSLGYVRIHVGAQAEVDAVSGDIRIRCVRVLEQDCDGPPVQLEALSRRESSFVTAALREAAGVVA